MLYMKFLSIFIFMLGVLLVFLNKKHLIRLIISIEFIVIGIILIGISLQYSNAGVIMLLLTLGVCEASLCLTLVFLLVRHYGSDILKNLLVF